MRVVDPITVVDAVLQSTNLPEADAPAHSMATTYALGDEIQVVGPNMHLVYRSLQNVNTGHNPLDEPENIENAVWWIRLGATNRWKPFDAVLDSQATHPETINYVLNAPGRIDAIALLNVSAKEVVIKITDADFGVVYEQTHSLIFKSGINTYYKWCFTPIVLLNDFAVTNLPNYANTTIEITLNRPGNEVGIGEIVLGKVAQVGLTKENASIALVDYSVKKVNQFGDATLQQGSYSKEQDLSMSVATDEVSSIFTFMARRRGKKTLYIATEKHNCTIAYGWFESLKEIISYGDYSVLTAKIRGLR